MKFFAALFVFQLLIHGTESQNDAIPFLGSAFDSVFDPPDLTAIVNIPSGQYQLEAFKCKNNDNALKSTSSPTRISELSWVSIGMPKFVQISSIRNPNVSSLFFPTETGFVSNIEMLTNRQRDTLASVATEKYGIKLSRKNIINMILSKFVCTLTIPTQSHTQVVVTGNVSNFHTFPLIMKFRALGNKKTLFQRAIENIDVDFQCDTESEEYLSEEKPPLAISSEQAEYAQLMEQLFDSEQQTESAVNLTFIESVARGTYDALNIEKDYKMSEADFVPLFADDLVSQVSDLCITCALKSK